MEPWTIYFAGWIITVITAVLIRQDNWKVFFNNLDVTSRFNWKKVIIIILISISVTIVGGMTAGEVIAELIVGKSGIIDIIDIINIILLTVMAAICIYGVGSRGLNFGKINKKTRIFFIVIFIISILFWGPYLAKYYRNIEMIEEKKLESKKIEEVVYFSVKDSNINCLFSEDGEEEYECISADNAKIDVDDNIEEAYVEIYSYTVTKKKINNNNGKEKITNEWEIREYSFHLNGEVMK